MSFSRAQVAVISSVDWDAAWQRHQIFAAQLADAGHEVFFVENTGFRNPRLRDLSRIVSRLRSLASAPKRPAEELPAGLRVVAPAMLPPTFRAFRAANSTVLIPRLVRRLRAQGLKPGCLVICYFPTPTTLALIEALEPRAVVYDCASNFRGHPAAPADLPLFERLLLDRSALVVTDSDFLFQQKKKEHRNVVQIHQGVPEKFFAAKPARGTCDTFCYYGTWSADLDARYLDALTGAGLDVTISGFVKPGCELPAGVKVLQPTSPERLVERLEDFEVFLLPYRISEFTRGVIPAKIYECLAMGRPAIAAPLPSLLPFSGLIYIAETPADCARIARDLPKTETPQLREKRIALAREHTYAAEFRRLTAELERAWEKAGRG